LDPSVADVLREEAAFEAQQRARDKSALETQEELGLFGPLTDQDTNTDTRGGSAAFPDIDDISSTLEPVDAGRMGQSGLPQTDAARRRSFLSGLAIPLCLAALMTGVYLFAPTLAAAIPALDAPLSGFVALVEQARIGLAGLLGVAPTAP
jgi:hypothetical protein